MSRKYFIPLSLSIFFVLATDAIAQINSHLNKRPSPTEWFLEDLKYGPSNVRIRDIMNEHFDWSYISFGAGYHMNDYMQPNDTLYEAELNQTLHWREYRPFSNWKVSIDVPIRIQVRQFNISSSPVRTPSFNPGVRLTIWSPYARKRGENLAYGTVGFHHYSNGQDADSTLADGTINTKNGSFSTDYLEFAFNNVSDLFLFNWYRFSVKAHLTNMSWEEFQNDQYQRVIPRFQIKTKRFVTNLYFFHWPSFLEFDVSYKAYGRDYIVLNKVDDSLSVKATMRDNVQLSIRYILSPPVWRSMSWFVRYDYGYDNYNINFQHKINRFMIGIAGNSFEVF